MSYRACIFDLDGTLCDSVESIAWSGNGAGRMSLCGRYGYRYEDRKSGRHVDHRRTLGIPGRGGAFERRSGLHRFRSR